MNTPTRRNITVAMYCCGCLLTWACSRVTAPDSDDDTTPDWTEENDTATDTGIETDTPTTGTPPDSTANNDETNPAAQTPELAHRHTSWILVSFQYQGAVVAVDPTRTPQLIDTDPTSIWNDLILYYDPDIGEMDGWGTFQEEGVQFEGTIDYAASNVSRGLFRLSRMSVTILSLPSNREPSIELPLPIPDCAHGCAEDVLMYWDMLKSVVTMQFDGHVLTLSDEDGSNTATYHLSEYDFWNQH